MRILFLLPGAGGGGGAHSVVQESRGLRRLGASVGIATTRATLADFQRNYDELEEAGIRLHTYDEPGELAGALSKYDIACATTWASVHTLNDALSAAARKPRTAYYVQDYEPLFCQPGSKEWTSSRRSYTALPDATLFAKTQFLCDIVTQNHSVPVERVKPSIDHDIYFPGGTRSDKEIVISAMLRPKTPRRAPRRTVRIMEMIAERFPRTKLITFGCEPEALAAAGIRLSERIEHRGSLHRTEVAEVLRASTMFLDLSDYQAFGRTGLEGMACGCIPVLPLFGGANEYLRHWVNGYMVDTRSDEEIMAAVEAFVGLPTEARQRMRLNAIETALDYSIDRAAFSEFKLFRSILN